MAKYYVSQTGATTKDGTTYAKRMTVDTLNAGLRDGTYKGTDSFVLCGKLTTAIAVPKGVLGRPEGIPAFFGNYPGDHAWFACKNEMSDRIVHIIYPTEYFPGFNENDQKP